MAAKSVKVTGFVGPGLRAVPFWDGVGAGDALLVGALGRGTG